MPVKLAVGVSDSGCAGVVLQAQVLRGLSALLCAEEVKEQVWLLTFLMSFAEK